MEIVVKFEGNKKKSVKRYMFIKKEDGREEHIDTKIYSEWEQIEDGNKNIFDYHWRCKNCGGHTPRGGYTISPDFCPVCGAEMGSNLNWMEKFGLPIKED